MFSKARRRWLSQEVKHREQPAVAVGRMSRGSHLGVAVALWWRHRSAVAGAAVVSLAAVAGGAVEVAAVAVGAVAAGAVAAAVAVETTSRGRRLPSAVAGGAGAFAAVAC